MKPSRRSFIGMVLGVATCRLLSPLVAQADRRGVDPALPLVAFMHLDTGEVLPLGPVTGPPWTTAPYVATEKFTVVAWSLYNYGELVVDEEPRFCPATLRPGDSITLDLTDMVDAV